MLIPCQHSVSHTYKSLQRVGTLFAVNIVYLALIVILGFSNICWKPDKTCHLKT